MVILLTRVDHWLNAVQKHFQFCQRLFSSPKPESFEFVFFISISYFVRLFSNLPFCCILSKLWIMNNLWLFPSVRGWVRFFLRKPPGSLLWSEKRWISQEKQNHSIHFACSVYIFSAHILSAPNKNVRKWGVKRNFSQHSAHCVDNMISFIIIFRLQILPSNRFFENMGQITPFLPSPIAKWIFASNKQRTRKG